MSEHNQHWHNPDTGQAECECCCGWALDYERLRLAFEGYIRDRLHRTELSDAEVKEVIDEWMAVAEDVEDVE
jgi:hypothetical protein